MPPELTAIVVVGEARERAQLVIDRIGEQTAASRIELLIGDTAHATHPRLRAPDLQSVRYLELPSTQKWGESRAAAVRSAASPIVAFTEDHSIPARTWAEALLQASQDDWAAAGYTFLNANPETYGSWAGFMTDYNEWAYPLPPGPVAHLPCNNVAYRRDPLHKLGDRLGELLHSDVLLQEYLARRGGKLTMVRDAVVSHQNYESLGILFSANFIHCRLIAAGRVASGRWGALRRAAYAVLVPVVVPFLKLARVFRTQIRRKTLWTETLISLPVMFGVFVWSSIGEAIGYILGYGDSIERFKHVETGVVRSQTLRGETP
jgi:hypothetical protein